MGQNILKELWGNRSYDLSIDTINHPDYLLLFGVIELMKE